MVTFKTLLVNNFDLALLCIHCHLVRKCLSKVSHAFKIIGNQSSNDKTTLQQDLLLIGDKKKKAGKNVDKQSWAEKVTDPVINRLDWISSSANFREV